MESKKSEWETPIRVLVSLGDASLRRATEEELFQRGAKTYAFEDGGEIVSVAGAIQFDLILVDYELPEASGPEVVEAVRRVRRRERLCTDLGGRFRKTGRGEQTLS